jgi:hypothetical protein
MRGSEQLDARAVEWHSLAVAIDTNLRGGDG